MQYKDRIRSFDQFLGVTRLSAEHLQFIVQHVFEKLLKARSDAAYGFIIEQAIKKNDPDAIKFLGYFASKEYSPYISYLKDHDRIVEELTSAALAKLAHRDKMNEPPVTATWTEELGEKAFEAQMKALKVKPEVQKEKMKNLSELIDSKTTTRHISYFYYSDLEE